MRSIETADSDQPKQTKIESLARAVIAGGRHGPAMLEELLSHMISKRKKQKRKAILKMIVSIKGESWLSYHCFGETK